MKSTENIVGYGQICHTGSTMLNEFLMIVIVSFVVNKRILNYKARRYEPEDMKADPEAHGNSGTNDAMGLTDSL